MLRDELLRALRLAAPEPVRETVEVSPWQHLSEAEFEEARSLAEALVVVPDPVGQAALERLFRRGQRRGRLGFSERPGPEPRSRWVADRSRCIQGDPDCTCLVEMLDGDLESFDKWDVWHVHVPRHRVIAREYVAEVSGV